MWDFEHGDAGKDFDISYTVPHFQDGAPGNMDLPLLLEIHKPRMSLHVSVQSDI